MDYTIDLLDLVHTRRLDDDRVDRIHFRLTVWVLVFGASIVFLHSYAGDPIECWAPGEWPEPWIEYANEFCFIESMYNAPLELDMDYNPRNPNKPPLISYYAWMPFLLAGQALAFFLPYFLWTSGNRFSGIFVHAINNEIRLLESRGFKSKSAGRTRIANRIFFTLQQQHNKHGSKEPVCSTFFRVLRWVYRSFKCCMGPCGLSVFYLFIKLLYFSVAAFQLYFVLRWVDIKDGWLRQMPFGPLFFVKNRNWTFFPRIGTCDVDIRHIENDVVRYTLQCVLRTNVINQQIFVFMAWWLAGLMCLSALNIFQWLFLLFQPSNRLRFVRKAVHEGRALNLAGNPEEREQKREEREKKFGERRTQLERRREQLKANLRRSSSPNASSDSKKRKDTAGCSTHPPLSASSTDCPLSVAQLDALADHIAEWELDVLRSEFLTDEQEEESGGKNVAPEEYFAQLPEFADFLGADGFLLFRFMGEHTSKLATIQILAQVYDRFRQHSNL